jgi:hypothetical protein
VPALILGGITGPQDTLSRSFILARPARSVRGSHSQRAPREVEEELYNPTLSASVKRFPPRNARSGKLGLVDTRKTEKQSGGRVGERTGEPGLGAWIRRNPWLLTRLFIVMVFTFGASTTAANFSYGLEGEPVTLSAEQLERGELPPGTELGDYVELRGTPEVGENLDRVGTPESEIAVSSRYSTSYFYFRLKETGDDLLIQTAQGLPDDLGNGEERTWRGKLETVGTVIFHDTTQEGLEHAGLPRDESIPVVSTGDTPEYYRRIFPAYSAIIALWLASLAWLIWKRNEPFLDR